MPKTNRLASACLVAAGCSSAPLEAPTPRQAQVATYYFAEGARTRADVLFLIDNGNATPAEVGHPAGAFHAFAAPLLALGGQQPVDLHIGVVTSDFGAGRTGAPGCTPSGPTGGGDQGKLQATGKKADPACQPPVGGRFAAYAIDGSGAVTSNLPPGQDLATTFSGMAAVGASGCGFQAPLESVYAALHNAIPDNAGFLRDDAVLAVFFVTSKDDASAPPDTDLFDKSLDSTYGYEDSYRPTRFGVLCGDPAAPPPYGDSGGPLAHCVPAPNPDGVSGPGKLYDVERYIQLFTATRAAGGLKDDPGDVVLAALDGPETPFQVILSNPGTPLGQPYVPCAPLSENSNPPCVPVLSTSCVGANPALFGKPAVRLNAVVRSVKTHAISSVCDADWGPALEGFGQLVAGAMAPGPACITAALPRDPSGNLLVNCTVTESSVAADGTTATSPLPLCDATHRTVPCAAIGPLPACATSSPNGYGIAIDRGPGAAAPKRATLEVQCTTAGG